MENTPNGPSSGYRGLTESSPAMALAAASKLASRSIFTNFFLQRQKCSNFIAEHRKLPRNSVGSGMLMRRLNAAIRSRSSIVSEYSEVILTAIRLKSDTCSGLMQVSVAESQRDEALAQLKEYKAEVS
jgi:hypothetical protein